MLKFCMQIKLLSPEAFFSKKCSKYRLGSLQCSCRPPSWVKGGLFLRGEEGRGRQAICHLLLSSHTRTVVRECCKGDEIWYTTSDIEPGYRHVTKIEIFKIQDGGGRHLENLFFGHKSSTNCPISAKFCMRKQNCMLTRATGKMQVCKIQDGGRHFENR